MQIVIRKATIEDANIISSIGIISWQEAYRGIISGTYLDSLSVEQREKTVTKSLQNPNIYFAIAEVENKAAGMICFHPSYHEPSEEGVWEVGAIYLLPQYWSKGIGSALMKYALDTMREKNIKTCDVWVLEDNHRARRFYEYMSFVHNGKKEEITIGDKELIEVCYSLML